MTLLRTAVFSLLLGLMAGMHLGGTLAGRAGVTADPQAGSVGTDPWFALRVPSMPLVLPVTVTGYSSEPAQTDSTPFLAAWGDDVRFLRARGYVTLAVSRDLEDLLPPGTVLLVADRLHHRWRGRVDIHFPSRGEAVRWGVKRGTVEMER